MSKLRRRHCRHGMSIRVEAIINDLPGGSYFNSEDLSYGGIYLKSDFLFEQGEIVDLAFRLPDETQSEIRAKARVAWVNLQMSEAMQGRSSGMGLEFMDMSEDCMRRLRDFVALQEIEITDPD